MRIAKNIKKHVAVALLLVFTLGATPRQYLHNFFYKHKDELFKTDAHQNQITDYKFNCGFVNIIADAPYEPGSVIQSLHLFCYQLFQVPVYLAPSPASSFSCFAHRGPPHTA